MKRQISLPQKLVLCASMACLLIPCFFVVVLQPKLALLSPKSLQLSLSTSMRIQVVEEENNGTHPSSVAGINEREIMTIAVDGEEQSKPTITDTDMTNMSSHPQEENTSGDSKFEEVEIEMSKSTIYKKPSEQNDEISSPVNDEALAEPTKEINLVAELPHVEQKQQINTQHEESVAQKSEITCDFSERRSDTCVVHGDARVHGPSSSIILADTAQERSWRVRPYSRKWETSMMRVIRELTLREAPKSTTSAPECEVRHEVPAVVFSTGGFLGNFFHDFTDVLIPLFATSRRFQGQVQFLVTNFNYGWMIKYESILKKLSFRPIIDLDRDPRVHCFREVHVGLLSHKVLGIDSSKAPGGVSVADFRDFLRSTFSLKRKAVRIGGRRPRLLMINRKGSRSLTNRKEVAALARSLGFKVLTAGPEETKNVSRFARLVNSCDVMVGVHGAGLTNMVFLPRGAALVQVVPWGGLAYACRHDFGEPAADMAVSYWEYEIAAEESSLIRQYPRDHPVFTNPMSIHEQGWDALWAVFLHRQSVRIDVKRFRGVLEQVLQGLTR